MRYPEELVEEVRMKNDIVDVVSGYVRLQKKGSTYFGLCPFHNEKTGSFSVSPNKQMYYCFGCGAGGNVFTFLMQYENYTFTEAMQVLADRAGIELPKQEMTGAQKREADKRTKLLEINKEAAKYFYKLLRSPRGEKAYAYFTLAAEQGNVYAAYFLEHWNDMPHPDLLLMATRLMHHLERVMEDNVTGRRRGGSRQGIDRKLARKMKEKKIAQGHAEDDREEMVQTQ